MKRTFSWIMLIAFLNLIVVEAYGADWPQQVKKKAKKDVNAEEEQGEEKKQQDSGATPPNAAPAQKHKRSGQSPTDQHKSVDTMPKGIHDYSRAPSEEELDAFLRFDIPPAEIPVLENALGDINQDSVINILDLLRLRDIVIGRGEGPSEYELVEGDLNVDGVLDAEDLTYESRLLTREDAVPHVIGIEGGNVVGNEGRTTFTIPPESFDTTKIICVEDFPQDLVEQNIGSNVDEWGLDIEFLAGAKLVILNPSADETHLPPGIGLIEEVGINGIVDTSSNNSVYNLAPDVDGDGLPELRLLGGLKYTTDSTSSIVRTIPGTRSSSTVYLEYDPSTPITLTAVGRALANVNSQIWDYFQGVEIESGMYVHLQGQGWSSIYPSDYDVGFISNSDTTLISVFDVTTEDPTSVEGISGIVVPALVVDVPTEFEVFIRDKVTGFESNSLPLEILPLLPTTYDSLTFRLLESFKAIDTLFAQVFAMPEFVEATYRAGADPDSIRAASRELLDSLAQLEDHEIDSVEAAKTIRFFENSQIHDIVYFASLASAGENKLASSCEYCVFEQIFLRYILYICEFGAFAKCLVMCLWCPLWFLPLCEICNFFCDQIFGFICHEFAKVIRERENECWSDCCPRAALALSGLIAVGSSALSGNLDFGLFCIHFDCNKFVGDIDERPGQSNRTQHRILPVETTSADWDLSGILVQVNDSPIAVSQATTDRTGKFHIPFNVVSGEVTLSAFDSETGFFDDSIGTAIVGDPIAEIHTFFGAEFAPDTNIVRHVLNLGEANADAVTAHAPNIEYSLYISEEDSASLMNLGFRGSANLSIILSDPDYVQILNNSGESRCVTETRLGLNKVGTYTIKIGRGSGGEYGEFVIGTNYYPFPGTPYLCDELVYDSLYSAYSPYISADAASITSNDTITLESGTTILFESGGTISTHGVIQGTATDEHPIILTPDAAPALRQDGTVSVPPTSNRKEQK